MSGRAERRSATSVSEPRRRDVFLGGSCGSSRWRDEIAVPMLLSVLLVVTLVINQSYALISIHCFIFINTDVAVWLSGHIICRVNELS